MGGNDIGSFFSFSLPSMEWSFQAGYAMHVGSTAAKSEDSGMPLNPQDYVWNNI